MNKLEKFELYYPARPFSLTQAWGIRNPMYEQFGFTHHNGVDFHVDKDGIVVAPCDATVIEIGYNSGAGNYVKLQTPKVLCENMEGYVILFFMHGEKILVQQGQKVVVGDKLMIADNTGFSTGPHTHLTCYMINEYGNRLGGEKSTNFTFDPAKYFNGYYAEAKPIMLKLLESYKHLITLLTGVK